MCDYLTQVGAVLCALRVTLPQNRSTASKLVSKLPYIVSSHAPCSPSQPCNHQVWETQPHLSNGQVCVLCHSWCALTLSDLDGNIAESGQMEPQCISRLDRWQASGSLPSSTHFQMRPPLSTVFMSTQPVPRLLE